MNHLAKVEIMFKGSRAGYIAIEEANDKPEQLAFVCRDRERRYFIASGSSMVEGMLVNRD
jgi:hypothetical protein